MKRSKRDTTQNTELLSTNQYTKLKLLRNKQVRNYYHQNSTTFRQSSTQGAHSTMARTWHCLSKGPDILVGVDNSVLWRQLIPSYASLNKFSTDIELCVAEFWEIDPL